MTGTLLASYVALWVLVVLLLFLVLLLYRQYGRSLMETREGIELGGLSLNEKVPALVLERNDGQPATVDWVSSPRATAALFALPGCPVCEHLWHEEDIGELAGRWPDVEFVWIDGPADLLDSRDHLDGWRFLRSQDKSAHQAVEVPASPYVYVVGNNSRVLAKGLVNHSGQLSNMIAQAFGEEMAVNPSVGNGHQAAPRQGTRHEIL
ncbi:MAG: hypothetical protein J2P27_03645 [Actinobacteria bacterium]|nr:hypothetical protein [Actinomycetota bacterium]